MEEESVISDNLRKIREERRLTKAQVAKKIDTTRSNITRWEKNTLPNVKYLVRLAKLYSVSIDRLVYGDKDKKAVLSLSEESRKDISLVFVDIDKVSKTVKCEEISSKADLEKVFDGQGSSVIISYR